MSVRSGIAEWMVVWSVEEGDDGGEDGSAKEAQVAAAHLLGTSSARSSAVGCSMQQACRDQRRKGRSARRWKNEEEEQSDLSSAQD